jgi:hypothetical protein
MKRHWLRGMLLGVSGALLLAGGVALAQGLWAAVDKDCVLCFESWPTDGVLPDEYVVRVSFGGWNPQYDLCASLAINGDIFDQGCAPAPACPCAFPCAGYTVQDRPGGSWTAPDAGASQRTSVLGEWRYALWQENPPGTVVDSASATFLVAETCEEAAEAFVPEPGTLMLLGSGLAGLAGYAGLRWRSRERAS